MPQEPARISIFFSPLYSLSSPALFFRLRRKNRGDTIRTCDFLVPNQAL
jgi:hypothetical protein